MELSVQPKAVVRSFNYSQNSLKEFVAKIAAEDSDVAQILLNYPTVYIIYFERDGKYKVYVGETNNIQQRTATHLTVDPVRDALAPIEESDSRTVRALNWNQFRDSDSRIIVIGHSLFNKSLTLDIEHRLMLYVSSSTDVDAAQEVQLTNGRQNPQNDYFTRQYVDKAFNQIWRQLRKEDAALFPLERLIRDSALFKASPFHKLNEQQSSAKLKILTAIDRALTPEELGHTPATRLILVQGGAGTGKTVLLSSVFYDLFQQRTAPTEFGTPAPFEAFVLVNHDEQVTVFRQIAEKLGLHDAHNPRVMKPTKFINERLGTGKKADVILVDEAHLLWTQGKQSYRGQNQLEDLLSLARVVVAVFDPMQILAGNQYWRKKELDQLFARVHPEDRIDLSSQMRIQSSGPAEAWIRALIEDRTVHPLPTNDKYRIDIFSSPHQLHAAVKDKSSGNDASEVEKGLSRLIATYDWPFSSGTTKPEDGPTWDVVIGDFRLPWNNQAKYSRIEKHMSWAERDSTIDEVGSIFTIQGFDLNYAGVILGPSVKYREGRIVFDATQSRNPNVIRKRTMSVDGQPVRLDVSEELLRNQLNVLLTRGVRGMGIYAVDDQLREALLAAQNPDSAKDAPDSSS